MHCGASKDDACFLTRKMHAHTHTRSCPRNILGNRYVYCAKLLHTHCRLNGQSDLFQLLPLMMPLVNSAHMKPLQIQPQTRISSVLHTIQCQRDPNALGVNAIN